MHKQPSGLCPICHREARAHGWFDARYRLNDPRRETTRKTLCGRACQSICHGRKGMIDPTPNELDALDAGGQSGGAYLDTLGQTDLANLSLEDWQAFIEVIVTAYCDHLHDLAGRDQDHITGMREGVPF